MNAHMSTKIAERFSQDLITCEDDPFDRTRVICYVNRNTLSEIILEAYLQGRSGRELEMIDL